MTVDPARLRASDVAVAGLLSAGYQALNSTLVMDHTDPAYLGRVMSVYMLAFWAMPMAIFPIGALADAYGAPFTIGVSALLLAAMIGAVGVARPSYRRVA